MSSKSWILPAAVLTGAAVLPTAVHAQSEPSSDSLKAAVDSLLSGASVVLVVDGLSCPVCAYGLERRLLEVPAVDTLVVRVSDGTVLIRTRSGESPSDLKLGEAVKRAGFTLREIRRIGSR